MDRKFPDGALPAKQHRAIASTRRIAFALENLLRRKHFDKITMTEIATEVGLTPGAIYRRFENKEALLPHIFARYRAIFAEWLERISVQVVVARSENLEQAMQVIAAETLSSFRANAHIFRTVHLYGRLNGVAGTSDLNAAQAFAPIAGLIEHYAAEISATRRKDAPLLGHILVSSVSERALYPRHRPAVLVSVSDDEFCRALASMFTSWLRGPAPGGKVRSQGRRRLRPRATAR